MDGIRDHELRDGCLQRSAVLQRRAALQRALIGVLDLLARRHHGGSCDSSNAHGLVVRSRWLCGLIQLSVALCQLRRIGLRRCGRSRQNSGNRCFEIGRNVSCGVGRKQREQNCHRRSRQNADKNQRGDRSFSLLAHRIEVFAWIRFPVLVGKEQWNRLFRISVCPDR